MPSLADLQYAASQAYSAAQRTNPTASGPDRGHSPVAPLVEGAKAGYQALQAGAPVSQGVSPRNDSIDPYADEGLTAGEKVVGDFNTRQREAADDPGAARKAYFAAKAAREAKAPPSSGKTPQVKAAFKGRSSEGA